VTRQENRHAGLHRLLRYRLLRSSSSPPGGYGLVILFIAGTYVLALLATSRWGVSLVLVAQTGTVWQVLRVSRARPGVRLTAAVLFGLALLAAASHIAVGGRSLGVFTFLAACSLYLFAPVCIIRHVAGRPGVDRETMLGTLAAYLLIGMAFGFAYQCLQALEPGPFFRGAGDSTLPQSLFFSFVTLTTTGYGDLVPAGNPGQSIAVLEVLLGQIFLVTAVAKVVDAWRPRRWRRSDGNEDDADGGPAG
jgi:hypothetical protein